MVELQEMRTRLEQYRVSKDPALQKTMSVPEMRKLLGLKKTESYWLVHRKFFKTEVIGGVMRVDLESFEKWYSNQVKHKKVNGEKPGKELMERSYSFQDAANLLGIHNSTLYEIWNKEERKTILVDFVKRIPREEFDNWYEGQNRFVKANRMPTLEDMEADYIRFEEAADLLGIHLDRMLKLIRTGKYKNLFEVRLYDCKKWISRKSFQLFLNAQTEYKIHKRDICPIPEAGIPETREYLSRAEAAELAGVSSSTISKWAQMGKFPCTGAGMVLRINRTEFLKWMNENREGVI